VKPSKLILKLQGLAVVTLLTLSLAACGSNSTSTSAPQAATTAAATVAAPTTASATTAAATTTLATTQVATTVATTAPATTAVVTGDTSLKSDLVIADGLRQNEIALLKSQIATFQKAYPNVKVTNLHYNSLELGELIKSAAGTSQMPDLIIAPSDYVADWTQVKALQPAAKVLDQTTLDSYIPNALGASQLNGVQWGVPYNYGNVAVLLYNRKLIPNPPTTTDEMVKLAKDLTDAKGQGAKDKDYGLALDINQPTWFVAWLGGFGGAVMDANNQPTLNTPEMVKTLQFYQDLVAKDKVASTQYEFGQNQLEYAFRDGRLGMMIAGDWSIPTFGGAKLDKPKNQALATTTPAATNPTTGPASIEVTPGANDYADKFELGVAPLPKVSATGKYPAPFINNKSIFIGAQVKADHLKAAKAFSEFLAKPEQQQDMINKAMLPTTQAALNSELIKNNPVLSGLAAQLAVAKPQPSAYEMRAIWDAILPNLQAVSAEVMKPADAAKKMQDMALQNLKLLKSN